VGVDLVVGVEERKKERRKKVSFFSKREGEENFKKKKKKLPRLSRTRFLLLTLARHPRQKLCPHGVVTGW